jgi:hypothetical protein
MNVSHPAPAPGGVVNPFVGAVDSYSKAADAWQPGESLQTILDHLTVASTHMEQGAELLKGLGAPDELQSSVSDAILGSTMAGVAIEMALMMEPGGTITGTDQDPPVGDLFTATVDVARAGAEYIASNGPIPQ